MCFSTFPASLCGVTLSYEQQVALADNLLENSKEYVPVLSIAPWVTSNHSILPVNTRDLPPQYRSVEVAPTWSYSFVIVPFRTHGDELVYSV